MVYMKKNKNKNKSKEIDLHILFSGDVCQESAL